MSSKNVVVNLELGHKATVRSHKTSSGFTHDWEVFVQGTEGAVIESFIEKVVFYLHSSFSKPKRVLKKPPYIVKEHGYGGFTLPIEIYFRSSGDAHKAKFEYDLYLQGLDCSPISNIRREKLTFITPDDEFRKKLIEGGGHEITSGEDSKVNEKSSISRPSSGAKIKPSSSRLPSGGTTSASDNRKKIKVEPKKEAVKVRDKKADTFTALFGEIIKTGSDQKVTKENVSNKIKEEKNTKKEKPKDEKLLEKNHRKEKETAKERSKAKETDKKERHKTKYKEEGKRSSKETNGNSLIKVERKEAKMEQSHESRKTKTEKERNRLQETVKKEQKERVIEENKRKEKEKLSEKISTGKKREKETPVKSSLKSSQNQTLSPHDVKEDHSRHSRELKDSQKIVVQSIPSTGLFSGKSKLMASTTLTVMTKPTSCSRSRSASKSSSRSRSPSLSISSSSSQQSRSSQSSRHHSRSPSRSTSRSPSSTSNKAVTSPSKSQSLSRSRSRSKSKSLARSESSTSSCGSSPSRRHKSKDDMKPLQLLGINDCSSDSEEKPRLGLKRKKIPRLSSPAGKLKGKNVKLTSEFVSSECDSESDSIRSPKKDLKKMSISKVKEGRSEKEEKIKEDKAKEGRLEKEEKIKKIKEEPSDKISATNSTSPKINFSQNYLGELLDLREKIQMSFSDRKKVQEIVDIIGCNSNYHLTKAHFSFDLCSLDQQTIRKLQNCLG